MDAPYALSTKSLLGKTRHRITLSFLEADDLFQPLRTPSNPPPPPNMHTRAHTTQTVMFWHRWQETSWRDCTPHSCRQATWGSCGGTAGSKHWPRPAAKGDHTIPLYHATVPITKKHSTVVHDEVTREKEQYLSSLAQIMNLLVFLKLTQVAYIA